MHPLLFSIIDNIRSLGWGGAFQLLRNGLVLGSLYALIALGYTMIYGILKLLNFAHGDVYMVGAFSAIGVLTRLNGPLDLAIGIVPAIAAHVRGRHGRLGRPRCGHRAVRLPAVA